MSPLVSVITPTWQRGDLLLNRCIPSVLAQDHPAVEHVIVSDGYEPDLYPAMLERYGDEIAVGRIRYDELAEHKGARWGHWCRLRGIEIARGPYLAWLDDDNSFRPDHVSRLAALLDGGAGFAYSQVLFHSPGANYVIGAEPPRCAGLDTSGIANLKSLHETVTWRDEGQDTIEWDLVDRWMQAGVSWAFDAAITADYYFAGVI
jgi:glycosyltransferase involved in cell wall biosynthesis